MDIIYELVTQNFVEIILLIGLIITLKANSCVGIRVARVMRFETVVIIVLLIANNLEIYASRFTQPTLLRVVCSYIGYTICPVMVLMLIKLVTTNKKLLITLWTIAGINALIFSTAFFSKLSFYYNEKNEFKRGPLGFSMHIVFTIYIIIFIIVVFKRFNKRRGEENAILLFAIMSCVAALTLQTVYDLHHLIYATVIMDMLMYYVYMHIQITNDNTFEKEKKLNEQHTQLMMSQIKPHFLYNTLGTIQILCKTDPDLAAETVETFSMYLRGNMSSMSETEPIDFTREIEHTKGYTKIEMLRFDNISVEYDIQDVDFKIPALSVQPLVENAIRHGVRARDEGKVRVKSYSAVENDKKIHVVEIEDNGVGFDVNGAPKGNGAHIGLSNVKERVEQMSNGRLSVLSIVGVGTKIRIIIPDRQS